MDFMRVLGTVAVFGYDPVADCFHGHFLGLAENVHFEGKTLPLLRAHAKEQRAAFFARCVASGAQRYGRARAPDTNGDCISGKAFVP